QRAARPPGHPGSVLQRPAQAGQPPPASVHCHQGAVAVLRHQLTGGGPGTHKEAPAVKVIPLNDNVLVKSLGAEEKTARGILLPDTAREKPRQGKVLAVGEGRRLDSGARVTMQIKVGDKVLFTSYGGTEIKIDGEDYLLLPEEDVLAVTG